MFKRLGYWDVGHIEISGKSVATVRRESHLCNGCLNTDVQDKCYKKHPIPEQRIQVRILRECKVFNKTNSNWVAQKLT
jgi:hypothetical protein